MTRVELRAERRLWRALSWAATARAPDRSARPSIADNRWHRYGVIAIAAAAELLILILMLALGAHVLLMLGVLAVLAVLALTANIIASLWWVCGGGRPVLELDGGTVRGRVHAATRGGYRAANWWDFSLPANRLVGVRLERTDEPAQRWTLALDLPDDLRTELLERSATRWSAQRCDAANGTPAAWQAGRMLRRTRRRQRLRALVATLEDARTGN